MNLTRSVAIFNSGKIASFAEETGSLCYNSLGYFTQSGKRGELVLQLLTKSGVFGGVYLSLTRGFTLTRH